MPETNDFPLHERLGLPMPSWSHETDATAIRIQWTRVTGDPATATALIGEQLRGLLATVGLTEPEALIDATIRDLADDYLVDFDGPRECIEITNARALLAMDRIEEKQADPLGAAIAEAAREAWSHVNERPADQFDQLTPDEQARWVSAARPAFLVAMDWRDNQRTERTRNARANRVANAAAEMQAHIDWLTTDPLPAADSFSGEAVRYVGADPIIRRRFAQWDTATGSGNQKWTLVNLGNGSDAADVPTRDLERA